MNRDRKLRECLPEANTENYPEVNIHSALYDKHGKKGLRAVMSKVIPNKAVDYLAISEWAKVIEEEDTLVFALRGE